MKVIGPPWMMVMVPVTKRVLSALAVATMVTSAGVVLAPAGVEAVGTEAGAV